MRQQTAQPDRRTARCRRTATGLSPLRTRTVTALLFLCLLAASAQLPAGEVVTEEWARNWQDDLRYLAYQLPRTHPDPFGKLSSEQFDSEIDELIEAVPTMTHHQIVVELTTIMAALGDGHTRVTLPLREGGGFFLGHSKTAAPNVPDLDFGFLPVRLALLSDGLFVESAGTGHGDIVGARVVSIGGKSAQEAIEIVSQAVHHDNDGQLHYQLPDYLVLPDLLSALGVTDSAASVELSLETPSGEAVERTLEPIAVGGEVEWVDALTTNEVSPPLSRQRTDRKFWYEVLESDRAVYFQYNEVGDEPDETLAAFSARLFSFIDTHPVDKLIIDLRRNRGGSNGLNKAVLHGLIRSEKLQEPGSLFAIVGGGTFSAAMMFSVDLAKHTPAIFVGEPTGSSPNHYGDSRKMRLPRSGLTVRVSTLYWQSDPRDERSAIAPHLTVETSSGSFLSGRDPVLEAILDPGAEIDPETEVGGLWQGRIAISTWTLDFTVRLDRSSGGWEGTLDIPDLGVENAPLKEIEVEAGEIRFVLEDADGRYAFVGRREGRRLYGVMNYNSRSAPFLLSLDNAPD